MTASLAETMEQVSSFIVCAHISADESCVGHVMDYNCAQELVMVHCI